MGKKIAALKPGDVVAIPRKLSGYFLVLHLARNQFGDAFGLFQGHHESANINSEWEPFALPCHVYSDIEFLKAGRWLKVGHREDLRCLFSPNPEIFHSKADNPTNPDIGIHGSGETSEGELRPLSESEATRIGLKQGTYRQIMINEQFEHFLQDTIG